MSNTLQAAGFAPPTITPSSLAEAFLAGRKDSTRRAYRAHILNFASHIGATTIADVARTLFSLPAGAANALALGFRAALLDQGLAPKTINARLSALRALSKMARLLGLVTWALEVEGVRSVSYRDTRGPDADVVRSMLDVAADGCPRDFAILRLLVDLGWRRGEVASLDLDHVDFPGSRLAVMGKGRLERDWVTMPESTKAALAAWIASRGDYAGAVFPTFCPRSGGRRISGEGIRLIVKRIAAAAGADGVRVHGLRHAAITRALELTGGDVRAVQRFSRHSDVRTVCIYDDARRDVAGAVASQVSLW